MPSGYYRYPSIYSDSVVFVCEDDLWTVSANGGIARRLTSNLGEVSRPLFSKDGSQIAFVGREEGQSEIYVMPALGGPARRLTFLGGNLCLTAGWTKDGKIIFADNARHWYLRFTHLYTVDTAGHMPEQLNYGLARAIAFGPDGGVLLGRNTDDPARWKRYRGGTAGQIWIDEEGNGNFRPLLGINGNLASPMWIQERIYFISDHEGIGNLYSCLPSGKDLHRHTDHNDFYARNASTDGQRIVYHAGADLYLYDPLQEHHQRIEIEFHSPQTQRNRKFVNAATYLMDWNIHPKGQAVAITAHGRAFTFANWEGAVLQHGNDKSNGNGVRYRLPEWLNDGKRLIGVTDLGGEERFVIWNADGNGEPDYFDGLDIGRPEAIGVNPRKDQIIFSNHRYELMFLDLKSHELRQIDRGKAHPIGGFDWSPDGEWVAYSVSTSLQIMVLKLWKSSSGETFPLAKPVLRDVAPAFDPLGKYIYFLSYRTFDPVYDKMQFDLGFPRGMKPYLITLQKGQISPFVPQPRFEASIEENEDDINSYSEGEQIEAAQTEHENSNEPAEAQSEKAEETLQIDLEGIENRVIAFPVHEGIYGQVLGSSKGKVLYSRYPVEGAINHSPLEEDKSEKGTLLAYDFEEQKEEMLVSGISDFDISADGTTLIYLAGNKLRVVPAGEKPADDSRAPKRKTGWLDLERVKVLVEPGAEWRQMFREAWRLQRDQFWSPDMAQVDWLNIYDRYLPLVDRISSRSEFSDFMWEMQGELGTSHAYEFGGDYRPEPNYLQGYLGADFEYDSDTKSWRITHILQGDPWSAYSDSPLNKPGMNIRPGDRLIAINGKRLDLDIPPAALLVNLAGQEVTLTVASESDGEDRTVVVKTLHSEDPARYREWVEANREHVHQATSGRVGYLHIPDMGAAGYAEFHRGFLAELDREGLVVDVRFNRGGHVSALLLEKLARQRIGYDVSRWYQIPEPYPPESVLGPMVALTNEFAGSDGDIFSHGFKVMNLGPLLGKRTWGGVVGIWPRHWLVDGTLTTQPEFSFWFKDVGWGVENYGTDPDIEVDNLPQDYSRGVDAQLDRAIEEVMKLLAANPPQIPDFNDRPSRSLPKLPRR